MREKHFPPDFAVTEGNAWMSAAQTAVQYVSVIHPGEDVAKRVKQKTGTPIANLLLYSGLLMEEDLTASAKVNVDPMR